MKLVVSELDRIQNLLQQLAAGEESVRSSLLPLLSAHIVVIPMTEVRTTGERGETKRIKLVTLTDGERKTIPVFTSEDLFFAWSNDRYQCLPIAVEDLALTLAAVTDIAVDLNTTRENHFDGVEFTKLQPG